MQKVAFDFKNGAEVIFDLNNETVVINEIKEVIVGVARTIADLDNAKTEIAKLDTDKAKLYHNKVLPELLHLCIESMSEYTTIYKTIINKGLNPNYRDQINNCAKRANNSNHEFFKIAKENSFLLEQE